MLATLPANLIAQPPVDEEKIEKAIDLGVEYLRFHERGGLWKYIGGEQEKDLGATALAGLAMLEAKVEPTDPCIQRVTRQVVFAAPKLTQTYCISLAILYLDRVGRPTRPHPHSESIRTLATNLQGGQRQAAWSYGGTLNVAHPDNSNTQFAILALWIARKHDLPGVEKNIIDAAKRFRGTQHKDGGWGYGLATPDGADPSTATMTCAGLIGMFLGFAQELERETRLQAGAKPEGDAAAPARKPIPSKKAILEDPQVDAAFKFLATNMKQGLRNAPHRMYFLWSLERVGVTYDVKEIDGIRWYDWGAEFLLTSQRNDGSWISENGPIVDTAFALLFLCRANIIGEIETRLRQIGSGEDATRIKAAQPPPERPAANATDVARLVQQLTKADAAKQSQLIDAYKKEEDPAYAIALAEAIPQLREALRDKARLALVECVQQAEPSMLREYLTHKSAELRRAAAAAAREVKPADALIPALIEALRDKEPAVQVAAEESLRALSGKNLGKDAKAWTDWWKTREKR
jgi:hypothetical protein